MRGGGGGGSASGPRPTKGREAGGPGRRRPAAKRPGGRARPRWRGARRVAPARRSRAQRPWVHAITLARPVRSSPLLLGALAEGAVVSLGAGIPLARGDAKPATIPVSEIREGMEGYGLTVFKGTQAARLDVGGVGGLHHFRP